MDVDDWGGVIWGCVVGGVVDGVRGRRRGGCGESESGGGVSVWCVRDGDIE